jgi:hypothetical protein
MASVFGPGVSILLGRFIWRPGHQPGRQLRDKARQLVGEALHREGDSEHELAP